MAFLLGSFTSGLFSGASDMFSLYHNYQNIQQTKKLMDAADEVQRQYDTMKNDTSMPKVETNPAYQEPTQSLTSFDDDPDLKKIPYNRGESGREGKAFGALPTTPDTSSPREGRAFGSSPSGGNTASLIPSEHAALPDIVEPGQMPALSGSGLSTIGSAINAGAKTIRDFGAARVREAAPTYLPPGASGPAGSTWAIPPAPAPSPGTPMSPSSALPPTAAQPTLANGQAGLGAQILAALNPTVGRTA